MYETPDVPGWREWRQFSPAATRIGSWLIGLDIVAGTGAVVLTVVVLLRGRAVPWAPFLLFAVVPLIIVGQCWVVAGLYDPDGGRRRPEMDSLGRWKLALVGTALAGLLLSGWLGISHTDQLLRHGSVASPGVSCPHPENDHGSSVCLSAENHDRYGADLQRFVISWAGGITLMQCGFLLNERGCRRNHSREERPPESPSLES